MAILKFQFIKFFASMVGKSIAEDLQSTRFWSVHCHWNLCPTQRLFWTRGHLITYVKQVSMSTQEAGAKGTPDLTKLFNDAQQSKFQIHNMLLTFALCSFDSWPLQEHLFQTVMCFRTAHKNLKLNVIVWQGLLSCQLEYTMSFGVVGCSN